jgi:methyltransferase
MMTRAFLVLLACVVVQRLLEVRVSKRHEAELLARGGKEHAPEQMPYMIALHSAWLLSCALEVLWLDRPFRLWLALPALLLFCVGQALRLLAINALGDRWTVKIVTLPGAPAVNHGIFQYLRHPNYLGVVLEIAALPLVHDAWLTAVVFSIANGLLLRQRIRAEEQALREASDYDARLAARPRMIPKLDNVLHEHG